MGGRHRERALRRLRDMIAALHQRLRLMTSGTEVEAKLVLADVNNKVVVNDATSHSMEHFVRRP